MKKRITALLCSLALVCALALPAWGAQSDPVYLLVVGDKFYDAYRPVPINGIIYVPYTIFDRASAGVDLGVYYGITPEGGTLLSLYSLSGTLTFRIQQGTCEDNLGNLMSFRAFRRNEIPYVPAAAVCRFFGLQYSFLPTSDRGTLIRITNPTSTNLSDSSFLRVAQNAMAYRYNQLIQSQTTPPAPSAPVNTPPPVASRSPEANGNTRVYFALDASQAQGDWTGLFPSGCHALFLFSPGSLAGQASLIRRAVAAGHSVGLLADPALDQQELLDQLDQANALLSHIARIKTRIYAFHGGSSARSDVLLSRTDALGAQGWVRWEANWRTPSNPGNVQGMLSGGPSVVRMDLSGTNISHIYRVVSTLQSSGYDLRRPLETEL